MRLLAKVRVVGSNPVRSISGLFSGHFLRSSSPCRCFRSSATPAQAAISWLRSKSWVSAPIVGANTPSSSANVDGLDKPLSSDHLVRLDESSSFRRSRVSFKT